MTEDEPWFLGFGETAAAFESPSQNARVWTEGWVAAWCFCPNCGAQWIATPATSKSRRAVTTNPST